MGKYFKIASFERASPALQAGRRMQAGFQHPLTSHPPALALAKSLYGGPNLLNHKGRPDIHWLDFKFQEGMVPYLFHQQSLNT